MFNVGFTEMVVIAIIALLFIGPKQLPEVARMVGRFINELRRSSDAIKDELVSSSKSMMDTIKEPLPPLHQDHTLPPHEPMVAQTTEIKENLITTEVPHPGRAAHESAAHSVEKQKQTDESEKIKS